MLSSTEFVSQSLELHLFFGRIMKEHSFFLEAAFTSRDAKYIEQADTFRKRFDRLLGEAVSLANGVVDHEVLQSGEVITPYTINAEMSTSYLTGVKIPTELTQAEAGLMGGQMQRPNNVLVGRVSALNQRVMELVSALVNFKTNILSNVLSCRMFTANYPLLIDHIIREAKLYLRTIQRIQSREDIDIQMDAFEQEFFWNRIMAEHSKFIRGLLDPTENDLINTAHEFGNEFDKLTIEAKAAMDNTIPFAKATEDSLDATKRIQDFKNQGAKGLVNCQIKSIIIPLLGDHVLREASHYLRLLKKYQNI